MASNHAIYRVFCGCPAKNLVRNRLFLKCLGFKNGRKMSKKHGKILSERCFFGVWRLLNGTKRRYLHGFVRLPGTKPCKLRWFWAMYASKWPQNTVNTSVFSSSCLQEWPQTTLFAGFLVAERVFSALGGFKVAQNDGTYIHGLVRLPGTKPIEGGCAGP